MKHKGKRRSESEEILFTAANNYLKGVMNGNTTLPTKKWKNERIKLTAERKLLDRDYTTLKDEVKEAEQIQKSVYCILWREQRKVQLQEPWRMER